MAQPSSGGFAITTLRQFRYFAKVVELGSMTRAAEHLNVAQPALGLQMRQLEQALGVTLLQRHSRGVSPTTAGQLLYERSRDILDLVERTRREMSAFQEDGAETIRFGVSPSLMQLIGSDLLVRTRGEMPHLLLRLVEELSMVLIQQLRRGELDMALAHDAPEEAGLRRTAWLREELLLITAPVAGKAGLLGDIDLADALRAELAQAGPEDAVRRILVRAAEQAGLTPRISFEVQSVQAMKVLVADGLAASILPYGSAAAELGSGRLAGFRITGPRLSRTLYLVTTPQFGGLRHGKALVTMLAATRTRLLGLLGPLAVPLTEATSV